MKSRKSIASSSRIYEQFHLVDLRAHAVQDVLRVRQELAVVNVVDNLGLVQLLGQRVDSLVCNFSSRLWHQESVGSVQAFSHLCF